MSTRNAVGTRGTWFAKVDGEALPCVHEYWWDNKLTCYDDKGLKQSLKADELVEAIKDKKRVILTRDKPEFDNQGNLIGFEREAYIAIYSIEDVEFDHAGLRFKFLKRLVELK